MRRLIVLVGVLVFVDTMLYAALTPLLPHFAHQLHLSKAAAGVLSASYAAGALIGALPGGLVAARLGPRRAVLIGLALMALASLGFAFASGYGELCAARLLQGGGSAFTWSGAFSWLLAAAPSERRGAMIGNAMGAAVFGALFGPVVGAAAVAAGRDTIFSSLAVLSVVLAAMTLRLQTVPGQPASAAMLPPALSNRAFARGLGLLALASLLSAILSVLGSLHLARAGWGAGAIGLVWLVGAALEGVQAPAVGRLSDRLGPLRPARAGLAAGAVISLALATEPGPALYAPLVVLASAGYGLLFTPAFTLIAEGAEQAGLAQALAFGTMNAAWAVGAMVGPAAAGVIANATGDWIPFLLGALVCVVTLTASRERSADPATAGA
ncbi:MAG TPA: MFS transporter [Solirubrobacteraceae bacterium]|jgi:MFS family permease